MSEETAGFRVTPELDEDQLWREFAEPLLRELKPNIISICQYGFTEMVNNVIDHSGSNEVAVTVKFEGDLVRLFVVDTGVGIFRKIRDALNLPNEHDAALELAKGKVSTDPERHTGEGILFTSRMFDSFTLLSGELAFIFAAGKDDWWFEGRKPLSEGTGVIMEIRRDSDRTTREIFDRFAGGSADFEFDTTALHLRLLGEESGRLVSRSQAKRLLSRLDQFKTVVLDFTGIEDIGPAFADEVFRVFQKAHPGTRIVPLHANENINGMILRAVMRNGEVGQGG